MQWHYCIAEVVRQRGLRVTNQFAVYSVYKFINLQRTRQTGFSHLPQINQRTPTFRGIHRRDGWILLHGNVALPGER